MDGGQGVLHAAWRLGGRRHGLDLAAYACVSATSTMGVEQFADTTGGIRFRWSTSTKGSRTAHFVLVEQYWLPRCRHFTRCSYHWTWSARDKSLTWQRHLTLTGWDRKDYSILKLKPDVVVLQMANPDVTDKSLESLQEMKALQELDLNGTQVTDAGLRSSKTFPPCQQLRLARTKITDQGFHRYALREGFADATRSERHPGWSRTVQAWRNAKSGRKAMQ